MSEREISLKKLQRTRTRTVQSLEKAERVSKTVGGILAERRLVGLSGDEYLEAAVEAGEDAIEIKQRLETRAIPVLKSRLKDTEEMMTPARNLNRVRNMVSMGILPQEVLDRVNLPPSAEEEAQDVVKQEE